MKGWVEKHGSSVVRVSAVASGSEFHDSFLVETEFAAAGWSESQGSGKW